MAEDNSADAFLIHAAIKAAGLTAEIQVMKDGELAMQAFDAVDQDLTKPCPHLLILDLNLPKHRGGEVLRHMRQGKRCQHAQVIIISTSDSAQEREEMLRLGANAYFNKPSSYEAFMRLGVLVRELCLGDPSR